MTEATIHFGDCIHGMAEKLGPESVHLTFAKRADGSQWTVQCRLDGESQLAATASHSANIPYLRMLPPFTSTS